jgi:hypothetical protein
MKFTTKARFDYLEKLISSIDDRKIKIEALYIINSIKADIDNNYAEIKEAEPPRYPPK